METIADVYRKPPRSNTDSAFYSDAPVLFGEIAEPFVSCEACGARYTSEGFQALASEANCFTTYGFVKEIRRCACGGFVAAEVLT